LRLQSKRAKFLNSLKRFGGARDTGFAAGNLGVRTQQMIYHGSTSGRTRAQENLPAIHNSCGKVAPGGFVHSAACSLPARPHSAMKGDR